MSAAEWLAAVRDAERRGELLTAFDLAERGLAEHPDDLALKHRAVLALARAGSTEEASRRFDEYGLGEVEAEDIAALRARIAKDMALAAEGDERQAGAARSAALYSEIFARTGGYYPAINAATLSLLGGEPQQARELAVRALELAGEGESDYYAAATEAEAHLLLGNLEPAREALVRAAALNDGDYGALATTRRQLRLICEATGVHADLLATLAGPSVAHFCGHLMGRLPAEQEEAVSTAIAEAVQRYPAAYAYGSLGSGADILWAEALLAQGAELHVVLPFSREEFVEVSVAPAGAHWVKRFDRCLAAASSVSYATEDAFLGDDVLFRYGADLSMGLALLRARYLDAEARQFAVWDGLPADGAVAGTAADVGVWQRTGNPATVVPLNVSGAGSGVSRPAAGRLVRALLFADIKGFSKLTDEQLLRFADRVLGAFAAVLDERGEQVLYRNTWGDAIYVVLTDAAAAAECALELQRAMGEIDLEAEGLPPHLALRLGGHLGPVFHVRDPVVQMPAVMGSHVSRTARIEPVTPPGSVYVTDFFAAALVLAGREEFVCDYVGHMPAAKDFGRLRMYRLLGR